MKKDVIWNITEIIIAILVVFASIPLWNDLEAGKTQMNKTMALGGLELSRESKEDLNVTTGDTLDSKIYYVTNNSDQNISGYLYFNYANVSLLKYEYLTIHVNDYSCKLSNLYQDSTSSHYLFLLDSFNLNPNETKSYNISLSIDDEYLNETRGKNFVYTLSVNTNTNI